MCNNGELGYGLRVSCYAYSGKASKRIPNTRNLIIKHEYLSNVRGKKLYSLSPIAHSPKNALHFS